MLMIDNSMGEQGCPSLTGNTGKARNIGGPGTLALTKHRYRKNEDTCLQPPYLIKNKKKQ